MECGNARALCPLSSTSDNSVLRAITICTPSEFFSVFLFWTRHFGVERRFNVRAFRRTRCRTTDVERTHGQLCTRFTDRLRGDNADRFADIDRCTAGQVAAIAFAADAGFACCRSEPNGHSLRRYRLFDLLGGDFVDNLAGRRDHLARDRVFDVGQRRTA
jgi:hypothetical protein